MSRDPTPPFTRPSPGSHTCRHTCHSGPHRSPPRSASGALLGAQEPLPIPHRARPAAAPPLPRPFLNTSGAFLPEMNI